MTTPLWVPLVVAVLGVLGTVVAGISGVVITQRWSDRRETKTAEREHQRELARWEQDRQRERERWAREDAARTFELRRESYGKFFQTVDGVVSECRRALSRSDRQDGDVPKLSSRKSSEINSTLQPVVLYGSFPVFRAAAKVGRAVLNAHDNLTPEALRELEQKQEELLDAIRADLHIPMGTIDRSSTSTQQAQPR